ncbi:MAG: hypothetical protein ACFE8P_04840, partial [Promethearchaeota archaeon]
KGLDTDPELQTFSDKLADELVSDWKIPIPKKITQNIQCFYMTTTIIIRKHLPNKKLSRSLFPLLVCPEKTDAGMILPSQFWDVSFNAEWK